MKRILIVFLIAVAVTACRTGKVTHTTAILPLETILPAGALNTHFSVPATDAAAGIASMRQYIDSEIQMAAGKGNNSIFLKLPGANAGDTGLINYAAKGSRSMNIRLFACVDLLKASAGIVDEGFPSVKTRIAGNIRNLVTMCDIDGLFFELPSSHLESFSYSGFSYNDFRADSLLTGAAAAEWIENRLTDMLEDAVAAALLVKPYLNIVVVIRGREMLPYSLTLLHYGIADAVIEGNNDADGVFMGARYMYPGTIRIKHRLKQISPQNVFGLDLSEYFGDAAVAGMRLSPDRHGRYKTVGSDGRIGLITMRTDSVVLKSEKGTIPFSTFNLAVPYNYKVLPGNQLSRGPGPWVEFRRAPSGYTNTGEFDMLARGPYPAEVFIAGEKLKQYTTGIFFRKVTLNEGSNRIRASVMMPDSSEAFYEDEFFFEKVDRTRKPFPLWADAGSISPAYDLELIPNDIVRISFQGSKGQEGFIVVGDDKKKIKCLRSDFSDYSLYSADVSAGLLPQGLPLPLKVVLKESNGSSTGEVLEKPLSNTITVKATEEYPMLRVKSENSRLIYNLGAPRLGGPIRSEMGPGVVLKANGKFGDNWRVRLSRSEEGFIHSGEVDVMPGETLMPGYYVTSMSCGPSSTADVLTIPWLEPVPYEVWPDPSQKRLIITMYGAGSSATWITHRAGLKIIDHITWQQTTPETFQIYVNLKSDVLWGYDVRTEGARLVMRIKYAPQFDPEGDKPLEGLRIAIEAGHGGSNAGAIGLSGLLEKDINLDLSFRLGDLLAGMGAEVVQVRDTDRDMSLIEKRDIAIRSGAHILISIHANAGGTGYLQVAGTSTYWHNPFWAPLATDIYNRLLELGLAEFGVVGSFNYTGIRLTQMPSVLVEQAFMSHAEDEEKMADPRFRQSMAEKIAGGLLDYLKDVKGR